MASATAATTQLEHLQARYNGTGHADTTKFEWVTTQHRDSYASYIGHPNLLAFFAVAENESGARLRHRFNQKMLAPCGLPPTKPQ
ncbi:hypothetical protein SmJEL517_g00417 [Synchytrium microbalum]|uniref:Splicing factor subunit n=1 Tax=Synchytrium microbalum TaxID=1806994 RepID=A0A507CFT0_9FUNG|nr:uncharacterized protein SmJEL517_g00417 [Synchytrium microbalum]TPX38218.1 hypothetical protein SmJEL517_g00417 [Synchytrium microbalum]